jgi:hypothetical protein
MKEICRCHLMKIAVKILLAKAGSGHSNSRLQQVDISNARAPSVPFDLIGMDYPDFLQREE